MLRRLLVGVAAAAVAVRVLAWQAVVPAPKPGLPTVIIAVGYPTGYVPTPNAPVELRVERSTSSYDGYIGFRLAVGRKKTRDPVLMFRALLRPDASWRVSTALEARQARWIPDSQQSPREVVIEWRDRDGSMIAEANAGVPPWSEKRALRVVMSEPVIGQRRLLGAPAVALPASDLLPSAGWYAGFSAIVAPIETWLVLSSQIRTAMYESGVDIVLFGVPRSRPNLSAIDTAVMPVDFDTNLLARPRNDADFQTTNEGALALAALPGVVWAASENILRERVPAHVAHLVLPETRFSPTVTWSLHDVRRTVAQRAPLIAAVLAIVLALILWRVLAKKMFPVVIAALVVMCAHPAYRNLIRRHSGNYTREAWVPMRPGAVTHWWYDSAYGRTPLHLPQRLSNTIVQDGFDLPWMADPPDVLTPAANGGLIAAYDRREWAYARHVAHRVEPSDGVNVAVHAIDAHHLAFTYTLPAAATYAVAEWTAAGRRHSGAVVLDRATGTANVIDGQFDGHFASLYRFDFADYSFLYGGRRRVQLQFVCAGEPGSKIYRWGDSIGQGDAFVEYSMNASSHQTPDGAYAATFLIPDAAVPPDRKVTIVVSDMDLTISSQGLLLRCGDRSLTLAANVAATYRLRSDEFRGLCRSHETLEVRLLKPLAPSSHAGWISLNVGGKE